MTKYSVTLANDYGTDLSSRHRAATLRAQVLDVTKNPEGRVEIDFANVRVLSDSFADELFGILVHQQGEDWFREHVRLLNLPAPIRQTILSTVDARLAVKS